MKHIDTVLITGASSGIGYEFAKLYAKNEHNLILVARNEERLAEIREELSNVEVNIIAMDLARPAAPKELFEEVKKRQLRVNVLINNAGYGMTGNFANLEIEKQLQMIQLNVTSLTYLTHLFLQDMQEDRYGRILNVGSVASFVSTPSMSVYAATKAFVLSFSESLGSELKHQGDFVVTALCPGPTKTNFAKVANVGKLEKIFDQYGIEVSRVAAAGYNGLEKRKSVVVPGKRFSTLVRISQLLPRRQLQHLLSRNL
ncbi:SDR family oxidoreductase [Alkalihalobacillus sp. MEB130]|uniref:SDR family NAD(P)-dependent oxidoreductase n=1 Tax=Alkalihalobacillus sp. MEB130 TaxID=2976704 RepID=UPI0028DF4488|nr:SDR family oxidoreductase [Alkalihalobacillus sp. MEB130]MDT8862887.1 SDR family oxidoreductase [Alkalihalobacillus sp. MEB130]